MSRLRPEIQGALLSMASHFDQLKAQIEARIAELERHVNDHIARGLLGSANEWRCHIGGLKWVLEQQNAEAERP